MPPNKVANTVSPGRKPRSVQARVHAWLILLIWAPAIFYRERVAFNLAGASCQWPALDEGNGARSSDPSVHVAVVADPQLTTYLSYRELGRGNPGLIAVEGISDAYMSRAFRRAVLSNDPEHVLFLGDLIDQGERIVNPEEWHRARRRFDRIFRWPRRASSANTHATKYPLDGDDDDASRDRDASPVSYRTVHGNHDVGYSRFAVRLRHLYARHEEYFGSTNFVRRLGGVDLVGVGAMALDGADDPGARSAQTNETWEFVESLGGGDEFGTSPFGDGDGTAVDDEGAGVDTRCVGEPARPRVLVTHVPLSKRSYEPGTCGDRRTSEVVRDKTHINSTAGGRRVEIPRHDGLGCYYQDYLRPATSRRLLDKVRPTLVLSGHDHDQCVGTHEVFARSGATGRACATSGRSATEHTIGSFSFLMGNPRPSFAMMTVRGGCDERSRVGTDDGACPAELGAQELNTTPVNVSLCFLPSQWSTFRLYGALGVVTVFAAGFAAVVDARRRGAKPARAAARGVAGVIGTCAAAAAIWTAVLLLDLSAP